MKTVTPEFIDSLDYVSFMGFLNETNRPPGGKDSMRRMAQNAFLTADSHVLHSGCNTGYCSFELSHLTKCTVTALDLNEEMLNSARKRLEEEIEPYKSHISFQKGDAHELPFEDNTFDLVMSGGSTAFMTDKKKVAQEYQRVCKPYGFVGDVFLYYHEEPPQDLVDRINDSLNISIQKWDKQYWVSLYTDVGLEEYYVYDSKMPVYPTDEDVKKYCQTLVAPLRLSKEAHEVAFEKLFRYMEMFNENHKYLSYAVLLCRKVPKREQEALFGT
jgi:ubiquinone/menaquinone biosynthesis C-methylase UbiE